MTTRLFLSVNICSFIIASDALILRFENNYYQFKQESGLDLTEADGIIIFIKMATKFYSIGHKTRVWCFLYFKRLGF